MAEVELMIALRFTGTDAHESIQLLTDPKANTSAASQVGASIGARLSSVTVAPTLLDESATSTEPLRTVTTSNTVHQVVARVIGSAIEGTGSEVVPQAVLASIANAVATTVVNVAASVGSTLRSPANRRREPRRVQPAVSRRSSPRIRAGRACSKRRES